MALICKNRLKVRVRVRVRDGIRVRVRVRNRVSVSSPATCLQIRAKFLHIRANYR